MTFPQQSSVAAVLGGQQCFRLNTPMSSDGDIYESEVSALAFALGPDSDIATMRVTYFDDSKVPTTVYNPGNGGWSSIILSPDRSYIGRIDARNETRYIRSNARKGRILIGVEDIYDPNWRPPGIGDGVYTIIPPQIDVIQYFVNPPSLISQRSDRRFSFQYLPPGDETSSTIAVPAYGRKSGSFTVKNMTGATVPVTVNGVRFSTSAAPVSASAYSDTPLFTTSLAVNSTALFQFKASTHGLWDYLLVGVGDTEGNPYDGGSIPISIILSDDVL